MSGVSQSSAGGNQLHTKYDLAKLFVFDNRFRKGEYVNNSGYDPITLNPGTVMGRVAATGKLVPSQSDATDGSQYPVGILAQTLEVDAGDTVKATICIAGDVAEELVIFVKPGDNLNTDVEDKQYRDRLAGDTLGINTVLGEDQTNYDNN